MSLREKRIMKFIRRVHMYAGLFMAPWVLMYGVSGFIYNHTGLFNGSQDSPLAPGAVAKTAVSRIPAAEALAQQVMAALNAQPDAGGPWQLSADDPPHFSGDLYAQTSGGGTRPSILEVDLNHPSATLTLQPANPETNRPKAESKRLKGLGKPVIDADLKKAILADAFALGQPGQKMAPNSQLFTPQLVFSVTAAGKTQRVTYNLENDRVDTSAPKARPLRWWNFLLLLHSSGGYPKQIQARFSGASWPTAWHFCCASGL